MGINERYMDHWFRRSAAMLPGYNGSSTFTCPAMYRCHDEPSTETNTLTLARRPCFGAWSSGYRLTKCAIRHHEGGQHKHAVDLPDKRMCRSRCCSSCATRPSARLRGFARRMGEGRGEARVLVLGNSVAITGDHATARTFIAGLEELFPHRSFALVAPGGSTGEPARALAMLQAFPRRAAGVAVAIVQYVGLLSYPGGEALIRQRSWLECRLPCLRTAPQLPPWTV